MRIPQLHIPIIGCIQRATNDCCGYKYIFFVCVQCRFLILCRFICHTYGYLFFNLVQTIRFVPFSYIENISVITLALMCVTLTARFDSITYELTIAVCGDGFIVTENKIYMLRVF